MYPKDFLGLWFNLFCISLISFLFTFVKSVCFGKYWRIYNKIQKEQIKYEDEYYNPLEVLDAWIDTDEEFTPQRKEELKNQIHTEIEAFGM